ncbi:MAG: polysulfide reductase NrfD [Coriobacteriales bacterium]|jgi:polysulfide reductase chain C|nr:polysulfide reductase NrfD [Coriobacteriales bacterium]
MSHVNNNKLTKHYWVWPIAWYLFLGGLGGGTLTVAGVLDFVFRRGVEVEGVSSGPLPEVGAVFALAVFAAVAFLGIGSFLLIFELGQPKVFLRVFLSRTAIIKYGACLLILAMGFGFVYFLFFLPPEWNLFYYSWTWLRDICCFCMMLFGASVMIYTGVLLSSMKSKPFWNTPALPVLFTVSALSTATALIALTAGMWPATAFAFAPVEAHAVTEVIVENLHSIDAVLVITEIVVLVVYVLMMYGAGDVTARAVATKWLRGPFALPFWGGMIVVGLFVPFCSYLTGGLMAEAVAPVLVLATGLLLRFLIVYSDARRVIPGEERYWARVPKGDEAYLTAWKWE